MGRRALGASMRMRPAGMPRLSGPRMSIGASMPRMGGLSLMRKFAAGGYATGGPTSMTSIMDHDAMLGMPYRAVPDYLLARMADGGEADPFEMPMRGVARRRARERYAPRISASMPPLESLDDALAPYGDELLSTGRAGAISRAAGEKQLEGLLNDMSTSGGRLLSWDPRMSRNIDTQRAALSDLWNAGPNRRLGELETRDSLQDMAGSMLDPTFMPVMGSGALSRLAPRVFRTFRGAMPMKARLAEFGAWNAAGPNVGAASDREGSYDSPWGMSPLPADFPTIGQR